MYDLEHLLVEEQTEENSAIIDRIVGLLEFEERADAEGFAMETLLRLQGEAEQSLDALVEAELVVDTLDLECETSVAAFESMLAMSTYGLYKVPAVRDSGPKKTEGKEGENVGPRDKEAREDKKFSIKKALKKAIDVTKRIIQKIFKQFIMWVRTLDDAVKKKTDVAKAAKVELKQLEAKRQGGFNFPKRRVKYLGKASHLANAKGQLVGPSMHGELAGQVAKVRWDQFANGFMAMLKEGINKDEKFEIIDKVLEKTMGDLYNPHPIDKKAKMISLFAEVGTRLKVSGKDKKSFKIETASKPPVGHYEGHPFNFEETGNSLDAAIIFYIKVAELDKADIEKEATALLKAAEKDGDVSPANLSAMSSQVRQYADFTFKLSRLLLMFGDAITDVCKQSIASYK